MYQQYEPVTVALEVLDESHQREHTSSNFKDFSTFHSISELVLYTSTFQSYS